jgi:histidyl-tRNA synthetase
MGLLENRTTGTQNELRPGKGAMLPLSGQTVELLEAFHEEAVPAIGAAGSFDELAQLLESKGWKRLNDDFGQKVYRAVENGNGEYRLTIVKTKRDELMVDIRKWTKS